MIISFLNMNDECSGCFFVISKQNLLTSDIDLCFFMCERVDRLRGARRAFHQFLCKYRSTSMYIYLHVYANIFVQIYIYLHVYFPPCICKYICANIDQPPCISTSMYTQSFCWQFFLMSPKLQGYKSYGAFSNFQRNPKLQGFKSYEG